MKRLLLLRHAQTMPSDGKGDKERKLTPQGLSDARALGQAMRQKRYQPDQVLCSPATRTRETLDAIMETISTVSTLYLPKIYEGGQDEIMDAIQNTDDETESLLIVAHNPSIHSLAVSLAKEDSPTLMNRLAAGYKPGTLTVLNCPCEKWIDLRPGRNALIDFLEPLDYNAPSTPARWT